MIIDGEPFRLLPPEDYRLDWASEWAKFFESGEEPELLLSKRSVEKEPEMPEQDPDQLSRAVIANSRCGGSVLWYTGADITFEIEEEGLEHLGDLGLKKAPIGISIWEGRYVTDGGDPDEGVCSKPEGEFRELTEEEWLSVKHNRAPWDPK